MIDAALSRTLSAAVGLPLVAARVEAPAPSRSLTPGERAQARRYQTAARRDAFRRGRAALKLLVGGDTAQLRFPHARLSLTHAGPTALAVALAHAEPRVAGLGVDLECGRLPHPESGRFFLDDAEQAFARGRADELLRLWTVKEALFKADPDNGTAALADYALAAPAAVAGEARRGGKRFYYATRRLPFGTVSVAWLERSC